METQDSIRPNGKKRWLSFDPDACIMLLVITLMLGPFFLLMIYAAKDLERLRKVHPNQVELKEEKKGEPIYIGRGRYFYK